MEDRKVTRQKNLEGMMKGLGEKAYKDQTIRAREKGQESTTSYGRFLVKAGIQPVADEIEAYYARAMDGRAGRKATTIRRLQEVVKAHGEDRKSAFETVAFIALKSLIDTLIRETKAAATSVAVGLSVEDEVRFARFREEAKPLFDTLDKNLDKKTKDIRHKRTVMVHSMNKAGVEWEGWSLSDRMQLGLVLLELTIQATGLAELKPVNEGKNNTLYYIKPTKETLEWIKARGEHDAALCPQWLPCVVPPKDWTTPFDGGYHSNEGSFRIPLIKPVKSMAGRLKRNYLEEVANRADEMPEVYEAVNAMQKTAWQINSDTFSVFQHMWENMGDSPKAGLPAWVEYEPKDVMRPYPEGESTDEQRRWKRDASRMWEWINTENSRVIQTVKVNFIADKLADEEEIYFPYQFDFRGRVYATPIVLNPQGSDLSRGILCFAHGKPLHNHQAYRWWCIHGANVWGEDKLSLGARVQWVEDNADWIQAVGSDPLEHNEWMEADSPWQFLAWACEYARREQEGASFLSHLPVQLDGSCNGLQHFSAMLRDPVGGEATNLVPSDQPQDIYARVAEVATNKLRSYVSANGYDPQSEDSDTALASRWLDVGVNRKTTKRAVMIRPYGGTLKATQHYVAGHLLSDRTVEERATLNPEDNRDLFRASMFMAKVIMEAINETVVASKHAMDWLQAVAKAASREQLPINWSTPAGFYVLQAYPNIKMRRVRTKLGEQSIRFSLKEEQDSLDSSKQATAISPNFVHSLDAAALVRYVCKAKARGVDAFSLVHDSYGTHAADTQDSVEALKEAFVEIYEQNDPLQDFYDQVVAVLPEEEREKLPPMPAKGNLDIRQVLESDYFFA